MSLNENNSDNRKELISITEQLDTVCKSKVRIQKNLTLDKFMDLVSKEVISIKKHNKIIKRIESYLCSDEFIYSLEPKDLMRLLEIISKSKYLGLNFLTKLYDSSTKNEILRTYFQDKPTRDLHSKVRQDRKLLDIVNEMKKRARENQNDLPE